MAWLIARLALFLASLATSYAQAPNIPPGYDSVPAVYPSRKSFLKADRRCLTDLIANTTGAGGWTAALAQAQAFLAQLNLTEKAYMVTGVGGPCVGSIAPIPRLGFNGLCLQDGPTSIRVADYASVFPAGITTAASFDKSMIYQRGVALGGEFRAKGANLILG